MLLRFAKSCQVLAGRVCCQVAVVDDGAVPGVNKAGAPRWLRLVVIGRSPSDTQKVVVQRLTECLCKAAFLGIWTTGHDGDRKAVL